jgi:hypothetical protein
MSQSIPDQQYDNFNRIHAVRWMKKTLNNLDAHEKHELPGEIMVGISMFNAMVYLADSIQQLKDSIIRGDI